MFTNAARRLAGVITRTGKKNLVVFNPLPQQRTDVVRAEIPAESVVDSATGAIDCDIAPEVGRRTATVVERGDSGATE